MKVMVLAVAAWLAAAAPGLAAIAPGRVAFDVWMNGKSVGAHTVTVSQTEAGAVADVAIDLKGKVGPFSFTYAHRCKETWRDGALQALDCVDREGARERRVRAERQDGVLRVTAPDGAATTAAAAALLPSSWWRADLVTQRAMLDTRKGKVTPITVTRIGPEVVAIAGTAVPATHYRLKGSAAVDVWYDEEGRWVKMKFKLRGQSFEYKKRTPVETAPSA